MPVSFLNFSAACKRGLVEKSNFRRNSNDCLTTLHVNAVIEIERMVCEGDFALRTEIFSYKS